MDIMIWYLYVTGTRVHSCQSIATTVLLVSPIHFTAMAMSPMISAITNQIYCHTSIICPSRLIPWAAGIVWPICVEHHSDRLINYCLGIPPLVLFFFQPQELGFFDANSGVRGLHNAALKTNKIINIYMKNHQISVVKWSTSGYLLV